MTGEKQFSEDIYETKIALACDLTKIDYDRETGHVHLHGETTIPPRLANYAKANGHTMPPGIYGFFSDNAAMAVKAEVDSFLEKHGKDHAFMWDLQATLEFHRQGLEDTRYASVAWKNPSNLEAAYIKVGKPSKQVADLLRYFTGDQHAIDRLTLEPWRVDTYAAVLSEVYGPMRALIFEAQMDDGNIETVIRIYDPTLISSEGITPLYRWLSSKDPDQPTVYLPPEQDWSGWKINKKSLLSEVDRADLLAFVNVPEKDRKARQALKNRRVRMLRDEGRFIPRDDELKALVDRRVSRLKSRSTDEAAKRRASANEKREAVG